MLNSTVLLVGSLVLGQAAEGTPSAYQHLKDQEPFIGVWEANIELPDTIPPDAPDWMKKHWGKTVTIRLSVNWGPEKGYLVINTDAFLPGLSIKGTILKAWDAAEGKTKQFGCDSMGNWHETIWTKQDDKTWTGKSRGIEFDGKEVSSDETLTLVSKNTFAIKTTNHLKDGKPEPDTELTFKRVEPAAKPAK
jgi:hypothetical protein